MTFAELESEWQRHGLPPVEELISPAEAAELAFIRAESRRESCRPGSFSASVRFNNRRISWRDSD
ncbi:MAG: hypothetical protein CMJ46_11085, partial [Planctomyces sp.]|nr:hypothetical protein [Planctomyces sp.]